MSMLSSMRVSRRLLLLAGASVLAIGTISLLDWQATAQAREKTEQVFVAKDVVADILPPPMYLIEARLVVAQMMDGSMSAETARSELQRLHAEYEARVT